MNAEALRRFEAKLERSNSGCILWTGHKTSKGYGRFFLGHTRQSHRVAYEHVYGPIPKEFQLDHLCRVRACVRPDHLRVVTPRENTMADGSLAPAKKNAKATHCLRGHEFSGHNLITWSGHPLLRQCRACHNARRRIRRAQRKVESIHE